MVKERKAAVSKATELVLESEDWMFVIMTVCIWLFCWIYINERISWAILLTIISEGCRECGKRCTRQIQSTHKAVQ